MSMNAKALVVAFSLAMTACGSTEPGVVKAADYGDKWPLTVPEARIGCEPQNIAYFEASGTRYALNGNALRAGLPKPDAVKKDPATMFVADFTEKAMQLCLGK